MGCGSSKTSSQVALQSDHDNLNRERSGNHLTIPGRSPRHQTLQEETESTQVTENLLLSEDEKDDKNKENGTVAATRPTMPKVEAEAAIRPTCTGPTEEKETDGGEFEDEVATVVEKPVLAATEEIDNKKTERSATTAEASGRQVDDCGVEVDDTVDKEKETEKDPAPVAEATIRTENFEELVPLEAASSSAENTTTPAGADREDVVIQSPDILKSAESSTESSSDETENLQRKFSAGVRAMCKTVAIESLMALTSEQVKSLTLHQAIPPGDFPFFKFLSSLPNLQELDLSDNWLGPQGFRVICQALAYNHSITSLNLANNKADTDSAETLGNALSSNKTLTYLDVSGNHLGKDYLSRSIGPPLGPNETLKCLKLSNCGATDFKALCEGLQENKGIWELDLSHNTITDGTQLGEGMSKFLQKENCTLTVLNLRNTNIPPAGMELLLEGILANGMNCLREGSEQDNSLKSLNVGGNQMESLGWMVKFLVTCSSHPTLTVLSLDDTKPSKVDTEAPEDDLPPADRKSSGLFSLSLSNCRLTDEVAVQLAAQIQGQLTYLSELNLSNNPELTTESIKSFYKALHGDDSAPVLSRLDFGLNQAEELPAFLQEHSLPQLSSLNLRKATISASAVAKLSESVDTGSSGSGVIGRLCLDSLKLAGTETLKELLSAGKECSIRHLSLSGCALSDSDVDHLVSSLTRGMTLHTLKLSANRITDSGASRLAGALLADNNCSMEHLDLSVNRIGNVGAKSLSDLIRKEKSQLHTLLLNDNCLGSEGIKSLVKALDLKGHLCNIELKDQKDSMQEDEIAEIFTSLAEKMGYNLESGANSFPPDLSDTCHFSINLQALGDPGVAGAALDSSMVKTDYVRKHLPFLSLDHAFQLSALLRHDECPSATSEEWNMFIGADKDAPSWLQVAAHRENAVYLTNLPASVTSNTLCGILENDADCNVSEICLMKDPVLQKPNGIAWVLMDDKNSVQQAVDHFNSGQAQLYSQPFTVSPIRIEVLGGSEAGAEDKARYEMAKRETLRKVEDMKHQSLLQASFEASKARHAYALANPAYAGGRVW